MPVNSSGPVLETGEEIHCRCESYRPNRDNKEYMKHLEKLPLGLLTLFTAKLMILPNWSFENAIVLVALSGLAALFQLKAKNDEIKELRETLEKHSLDIQKLQKQDEYLQTSVTSMKIAVQTKPQAMKF
jgi:hypothetical protein